MGEVTFPLGYFPGGRSPWKKPCKKHLVASRRYVLTSGLGIRPTNTGVSFRKRRTISSISATHCRA